MNSYLTRRGFIKRTTGLALSSALLPGGVSVFGAQDPKWPIACRDVHLKSTGAADAWSAIKAIGAAGAEVEVAMDLSCPNLFGTEKHNLSSAEGIQRLKQALDSSGCKITAFMMANHLDERLDEELEWTARLVKAAQQVGVETIRIDVVPRKLGAAEFLPFAINACKRMCDLAQGTGIRFGVENHGKITNDPDFLDKLFAGVGSPALGLTLDVANFYWWGHPEKALYGIYERFAPRVVHTHCKSIKYPADKKNVKREIGWEYGKYNCPIYEGDIDFKRVISILRKANYQGDLCVEDESLGKSPQQERASILRKEVAMLKQLE